MPEILRSLSIYLVLSWWVLGFLGGLVWTLCNLIFITRPLAWASIGLEVLLMVMPLTIEPPAFIKRFLKLSMNAAAEYFNTKVIYEDREAFKEGTPYIIGYEPHSVLPLGIFLFSPYAADAVPPALANNRILASSAGFWAPAMRHMWFWLGVRPVGKASFKAQLAKGRTVALCPGGVQELNYLAKGRENIYLRKRRGFVRLALEQGAPLVPVFAFGQTEQYSYVRLLYDWPRLLPRSSWSSLARRIGYGPILVFGPFFTCMPHKVPLTIVVGKPIPVPRTEAPSAELVDDYLQRFVAATAALFDKYKQEAGYPGLQLTIY